MNHSFSRPHRRSIFEANHREGAESGSDRTFEESAVSSTSSRDTDEDVDDSTAYDNDDRDSFSSQEHHLESFGEEVKFIEHKQHEKLFRKPKVRQYFLNNLMHREKQERKVSWDELFVDLIYVGAISKAGHLLTNSGTWEGFKQFCLVMLCILQHWRIFVLHSNAIMHEDLFYRFLTFITMSGLLVMGLSTEHAFDTHLQHNTSNIFMGAYLVSKAAFALTLLIVALYAGKLRNHILLNVATSCTSILAAAIFVSFPLNGTRSRETFREVLWWSASCAEFAFTMFNMFLATKFSPLLTQNRVAINIEHFTERYGLLVVIVLGEVVVGLLFNYSEAFVDEDVFIILLGLLIGLNISSLYFRAEGNKVYRHALCRHPVLGVCWAVLHVPLSLSIGGLGAAMDLMIQIETRDSTHIVSRSPTAHVTNLNFELRSIFVTLLAGMYFSLGAIAWCHYAVDPKRIVYKKDKMGKKQALYQFKVNLTQNSRALFKCLAGVLALMIGFLVRQFDCQGILCFGAVLTSISVLLEEWGRLRQRKCELDPKSSV